MSRKLIVTIHELNEAQRAAIRDAAGRNGLEAEFYESNTEAKSAAAEAEVIFGNAPMLAKVAPKLRWLCTPSAGVNQYAAPGTFIAPDVMLTNSSGAYGVTIAEHILMVTLELMRRQPVYNGIVARREWYNDVPVRSIHGCRAALLGTGDIGREAAQRLRAFRPAKLTGVNLSGRNPEGIFDEVLTIDRLDEVLPETDLVILSLPGTPQTRNVLDARRLALLPDGAIIVNVGRGNSIDEAAIEAELRAGRLMAALDVFETEPLPRDSTLWDCPNLLLTPHSAGKMTLPHTVERIVGQFLEDLDRYGAGEPLRKRVDIARGY